MRNIAQLGHLSIPAELADSNASKTLPSSKHPVQLGCPTALEALGVTGLPLRQARLAGAHVLAHLCTHVQACAHAHVRETVHGEDHELEDPTYSPDFPSAPGTQPALRTGVASGRLPKRSHCITSWASWAPPRPSGAQRVRPSPP